MYSAEKRKDVVTKYVLYGNLRRVAEECDVAYNTLYEWMREPWWKEAEAEIRSGVRTEMGSRMQQIVNTGFDIIEDRLKNGDVVLNLKTGELTRRPVPARDVQKIVTEILGKKISMEKDVDRSQVRQETITEMLGGLAKGFLEFNKKLKQQEQQKALDSAIDVEFREVG